MPVRLPNSTVSSHRLLPETAGCAVAKADLRKADIDELRDLWRERVGSVVVRVRHLSGLSLKEFAALLGRDERQVARWESGAERPQFDVLFSPEELRQPLLIAFAELAGQHVEIATQITVRRRA